MRNFGRHGMEDIGQLIALDEHLNHQIADTFTAVATSEHSWTEKIWTALVKKDGSLAVDFGLGRYHNRGVMDGWAAVARGTQQWTVRASRELRDDPMELTVGPLTYAIEEPFQRLRFSLAKNDVQPIAYDIVFDAAFPPFFEDRHRQREPDGFRIGSDVIRYHQFGRPSGWIEIEGERIDIVPDEWCEVRDHSWGTRLDVGQHSADIKPTTDFGGAAFGKDEFVLIWSPFLLTDPNGEQVAYHFYYMSKRGHVFYSSGYRNLPDGTQEKVGRVRPELAFDDRTRRLKGGRVHFDMLQGGTRTVEVEVAGPSAVHLGPGLYLGYEGKKHGSWKGPLEVEGDAVADTLDIPTLQRIHQLRDCPIRVTEGDMTGHGIMETIIHGADPALGLTRENSLV
ncbi:hypothetical protein M0208_16280 [Sphingomonas sp. SUN019]|uniref:hypothetical protein n=1 Tax=Sphingomonas sp. SUN019 TaxID=2937788 RepID=UPI002164E4EB|nr:hypothetical protein [Sphingomonas sp. SUN019]UVO51990.1 hypothetical protein M0208_16280 [Sphingomonas sp. SUN019]